MSSSVRERSEAPAGEGEARARSEVGVLPRRGLQLSVLALGCGIEAIPHFTVGNMLQVLGVALMLPALRLMTQPLVVTLVALILGIGVSSIPLHALTDESPQWIQIPYFALAALYVCLCLAIAPHVDVRRLLRWPVNTAALVLAFTAFYQRSLAEEQLLTLYFDDKSHAVVAAAVLAFLVLWVNQTFWSLPFAILMTAVAIATASRIIAIGIPFIVLALAISYVRSRATARTTFSVYLHHLTLSTLPLMVWFVLNSSWSAYLRDRLSSNSAAGAVAADSTNGHLQLALLAVRLKLVDPLVALLGVGPGGFPAGVRGFHIDASDFGRADPAGYYGIMGETKFVPIHSVSLTMLVEYPFWVAILFFGGWFISMIRLARQRELILLVMSAGLFAMTSLYSAHNEFFFWVAFVIPLMVAMPRPTTESPPPQEAGPM